MCRWVGFLTHAAAVQAEEKDGKIYSDANVKVSALVDEKSSEDAYSEFTWTYEVLFATRTR